MSGVNPNCEESMSNAARIPTPTPCPTPHTTPGCTSRLTFLGSSWTEGTNSMSKAIRPLPWMVIPMGKPMEKLSAMVVVSPPAWVTRGSTKPMWPPTLSCAFAAGAASARKMRNIICTQTARLILKVIGLIIFSFISFQVLCFRQGPALDETAACAGCMDALLMCDQETLLQAEQGLPLQSTISGTPLGSGGLRSSAHPDWHSHDLRLDGRSGKHVPHKAHECSGGKANQRPCDRSNDRQHHRVFSDGTIQLSMGSMLRQEKQRHGRNKQHCHGSMQHRRNARH